MSVTTSEIFAEHLNDLEGVVSSYSPVLFRVAFRRLRNVQDAEDAVQDALLSACKHISQFEGRSQLSTWLTSIVTNAAGMKIRQTSRLEIVSLDQSQSQENDGATFANKLKDIRPNPETICAKNEMDETFRRALAQLSPKLRDAIQMYLDGISTREAANALGITTHAVKSRVRRGRAMLNLLLNRIVRKNKAAEPAPIVDATSIVCGERRSPNGGEASAATEALALVPPVE
ncbi:MAG: polymerase, sigma-24 subunit, subfamily [Candidatus Acidoferrum typicum]|nr:polymerase, sigma-24 subunit, subfamily [Candidatus Acidoferrum typicum]